MNTPPESFINSEEPIDSLSYEQAFAALEAVVDSLESEKQPLKEALALFERGQALIRRLSFLLDQAELKVKQLSGEELVDFSSNSQS